jgi:16S rRNA processing protein RimM
VDEATGSEIGRITEILPLSAHPVYVITGQREILVPAVPEFVHGIDIDAGTVRFHLIEGM